MQRGRAMLGAVALAVGSSAAGSVSCTSVDPGPNFVVPDEQFNADFFFCHVEPEFLVAKSCGAGDPGAGDPAGGCHFNAAAVSGMSLREHPPVDCAGGDSPVNRAQIGAGSAPQANLQSVSLEMGRDVDTTPLVVRPTGQNHPRVVFAKNDPVVEVLRAWARK